MERKWLPLNLGYLCVLPWSNEIHFNGFWNQPTVWNLSAYIGLREYSGPDLVPLTISHTCRFFTSQVHVRCIVWVVMAIAGNCISHKHFSNNCKHFWIFFFYVSGKSKLFDKVEASKNLVEKGSNPGFRSISRISILFFVTKSSENPVVVVK